MRSKALLSVIVGAASLLGSAAVQAQEPPPLPPPSEPSPAAAAGGKKMLIGADLALALPVGNFGDAAGFGVGVLPRFEFTVAPKLNLTARLGYIYHLEKNHSKIAEIPLLAGVKYDLTDAIYAAVELGLVHSTWSTDLLGPTISSSIDKLGATIGAGYRAGDLDFRLGLHFINLGEAGDSMEIVANAGYNFWRG